MLAEISCRFPRIPLELPASSVAISTVGCQWNGLAIVAADLHKSALAILRQNRPRRGNSTGWRNALEQMNRMKVRAEQQALAKWGLNYVIEKYLPEKIKKPETWLP